MTAFCQMNMRTAFACVAITAVVGFSLSGCGGSGALTETVGAQTATYRVVDLDQGSSTYVMEVPDLADNPEYRDRLLVMRRIAPHQSTLGARADDAFADTDERAERSASIPELYIGVFELTRRQWQRIAAGQSGIPAQPWAALGVSTGADDHPATGMAQIDSETALASWGLPRGLTATLPSEDEWEDAARAGGGIYPFDPENPGEVARFARVRETLSSAITTDTGTAPVGRRAPNAWGLFDTAGNAAELTSTIDADEQAHVHGGSWNDPVAAARSSNATSIPPFAGHPLVGLRVVVRP